jgi:5-oxoprolinase (ATP-hydrolysing)
LSNGRKEPAFGLLGGATGAPGLNRVIRAAGQQEIMAACAETQLQAGDEIEIQTPGGGGFGAA